MRQAVTILGAPVIAIFLASAALGQDFHSAHANALDIVSYEDLESGTFGGVSGRITFETHPVLPEPGLQVDEELGATGVRLGKYFAGQQLEVLNQLDAPVGTPEAPMSLISGASGHQFAIAYHAGFGSNALFPLGPEGFGTRSGRGEGAIALLFDASIDRFGMKIHADYDDPLGTRPTPGPVTFQFYNADGALAASAKITPNHGIVPIGFVLPREIRAVSITHQDPGGIAIDDILYPLENYGS